MNVYKKPQRITMYNSSFIDKARTEIMHAQNTFVNSSDPLLKYALSQNINKTEAAAIKLLRKEKYLFLLEAYSTLPEKIWDKVIIVQEDGYSPTLELIEIVEINKIAYKNTNDEIEYISIWKCFVINPLT